MLIGLLGISVDHCNFHLLVVLFDGLGPLLENLELLEEVASIVRGHKSLSHDLLHSIPSGKGGFSFLLSKFLYLFRPYECILIELEGGHGNCLWLVEVVGPKILSTLSAHDICSSRSMPPYNLVIVNLSLPRLSSAS